MALVSLALIRVVVHVTREVDLANSAEHHAELLAASSDGRLVVLDLRAVTFIDANGLSALLDGRRTAVLRGGSLVLENVPPSVSRILRITALDAVLPVSGRGRTDERRATSHRAC